MLARADVAKLVMAACLDAFVLDECDAGRDDEPPPEVGELKGIDFVVE